MAAISNFLSSLSGRKSQFDDFLNQKMEEEDFSETDDCYDEAGSDSDSDSSEVIEVFGGKFRFLTSHSSASSTTTTTTRRSSKDLIENSPHFPSSSSSSTSPSSHSNSSQIGNGTPSRRSSQEREKEEQAEEEKEEEEELRIERPRLDPSSSSIRQHPEFAVEAFNPLDSAQQNQLHDIIFHFSHILHALTGEGQLTLAQDQRLQNYIGLFSELKDKIVDMISIHLEDPSVIEPLLELNDALGEVLDVYRRKRPDGAFESDSDGDIQNFRIGGRGPSVNQLNLPPLPPPSASSSSQLERDREPETCPICYMEQEPLVGTVILDCGDSLCRACAVSYLTIAIEEGKVTNLYCPVGGECRELVTEDDILHIVPALIDKYREFSYFARVRKDPNTRWCPKPGCNSVAFGSVENPKLTCGKCETSFCFNCTYEWHEGRSCRDNEKGLVKKGVIDKKSERWKKKHRTKPCPACGASIEKNHGCNHMTCSACSHQFCWLCLETFQWDHFTNGKCHQFSFSQRFKSDAADLGLLGLYGVWYGLAIGITVPLLAVGAPVYGIYKLGKKVV